MHATREDGASLSGSFDPWQLACELVRRHQSILIGLELANADGEREVFLDPSKLIGRSFDWESVAALYVLGDGASLLLGRPDLATSST